MDTRISLDQWQAFIAVVDAGGFAQAAERLNKSQSTVSYAVRQIEERLAVKLFTIDGRKAVLTPYGQVMHRRGRALLDEAQRLERIATSMALGFEAEVRIAVESLFPTWLLLNCLEAFGTVCSQTHVELHESVMGGTDELLASGAVDLAICADTVTPGFVGDLLFPYRAIAAAAPHHPLFKLGRPLTMDDLRQHRHLVIRDSGLRRTREGVWNVTDNRWTLSHKATSIRAAIMGLGFAWYAEDWIRDEISEGKLKELPLADVGARAGYFYLVYADRDAAGPATRALAAIIQEAARTQAASEDAA